MSIFKTKGIILKVHKQQNGNFLYTIFTQDYGKIICKKKINKKEKTLDLGYIVNFEISTKENNSIHKIKSIKILNEFNRNKKKFRELNSYLTILGIIGQKSPNGFPIPEIVNIIELINSSENIDEIRLILSKIKIISIFGELNENHTNNTVSKILKFINLNKITQILKLTGINEELKNELDKI